MAKFEVTSELASIIKSVRVQNNITAKSIAKLIGKSQSYISKLEKAEIKTIDEDELTKIFQCIYRLDENSLKETETFLERIYNSLEVRYTDEEINKQLWWATYDTVRRRIPVPADLVDDIVTRMNKIGLSTAVLCERINANEGISTEVTNVERYPFNEWQAFKVDHKVKFCFIRIKFKLEEVENVLNKKTTGAKYILLLAVSYYLHKIEKYGSQVIIKEEDNLQLNTVAHDYLNSFKFYSIAEKNKLKRLAKTEDERDKLLSSFDRENQELINKIILSCKIFSDLDIQRGNKVFAAFTENLRWDLMFMMALISSDFNVLKDISFSNKKDMLFEIRNVIDKYKELPKEQRILNEYDFL